MVYELIENGYIYVAIVAGWKHFGKIVCRLQCVIHFTDPQKIYNMGIKK